MVPAPLAVNVTSPAADRVPLTVILPLLTVAIVAVPAVRLPLIMVPVPDEALRIDADKAPPRFILVPEIRRAAAEAAIVPVVPRVIPVLASSDAAEMVPPKVICSAEMRTADPPAVIEVVVSRVVPADAFRVLVEKMPLNKRLLPDVITAALPMVLVPAATKAPDVLSARFCPTFESVSVTSAAVSVTVAEPVVLTTRVGAATLSAVMVPEPERSVTVVPAVIALPAADSFTSPEPAAVSVTVEVPESAPSTEMLPSFVVAMSAVIAATLPVIVVLPAEDVLRAVAETVPPRFMSEADAIEAMFATLIVPVVLSPAPAVAVRLPVDSVSARLMVVPEVSVAVPAILLVPAAVRLPLAVNSRSPPMLESLNTTWAFLSFIDTKPVVLAVTIGASTLLMTISPLFDCSLRRLPELTALREAVSVI